MAKKIKVFSDSSERLIKVFLEEEAKQYPFRYCENFGALLDKYGREELPYNEIILSKDGINWVNSLYEKIVSGIKRKAKFGANRYCFVSHGNAGSIVSELIVDGSGKFFNWKKGNIVISLCTCGNLDHWGGIILPEKYND